MKYCRTGFAIWLFIQRQFTISTLSRGRPGYSTHAAGVICTWKNYALLIGWKRVNSRATRVQSCNTRAIINSACALSKFWLSRLSAMLFHVHRLQVLKIFLLQFDVISTCKFFKDCKLQAPYGHVQFCFLWKICSWFLISNCTRNM